MTTGPFVILGNPENRRVTAFQSALASQGFAPAVVLAWRDYLDGAPLPAAGDAWLRVDSFGEDFGVYRQLLARGGYPHTPVERLGEVVAPAIAHRGVELALQQLATALDEHDFMTLNRPDEIAELFDKRETSRRYDAAGIPVPERLDDVPADPAELIARLRALGWREAYVKLSSGSSASCLGLVALGPQVTVTTTLEWDAPRWFNNRKVRVLRRPPDVDRALGFILSQGAHVERSIPKARVGRLYFDCRVVCVGGEPAFAVVRESRLPITNLHLGGQRGDLGALLRAMPDGAWDEAMHTCRKLASLYRSLHVGIDLMFEPGLRAHRVIEANAFGDLLPNLTRGGLSVYEWEIRAATNRPLPDVAIDVP